MCKSTLCAGFLGAALVGGLWLAVSFLRPPSHAVHGPVRVTYEVRTSPTTSVRQSLMVQSIEFHNGYVALKTDRGSGQVFFPENTISFSWRREDPPSETPIPASPMVPKTSGPATSADEQARE